MLLADVVAHSIAKSLYTENSFSHYSMWRLGVNSYTQYTQWSIWMLAVISYYYGTCIDRDQLISYRQKCFSEVEVSHLEGAMKDAKQLVLIQTALVPE